MARSWARMEQKWGAPEVVVQAAGELLPGRAECQPAQYLEEVRPESAIGLERGWELVLKSAALGSAVLELVRVQVEPVVRASEHKWVDVERSRSLAESWGPVVAWEKVAEPAPGLSAEAAVEEQRAAVQESLWRALLFRSLVVPGIWDASAQLLPVGMWPTRELLAAVRW